jgi:hypothetical protein
MEGDFTTLHNESFIMFLHSSGIMRTAYSGRVRKTGHVVYSWEKRNEQKALWKILKRQATWKV